jgi:carbon storage regulator
MLVLSRRLGEEIVIDGTIRVSVLDIQGGRVRLGITAPTYIPIIRPEVLEPSRNGAAQRRMRLVKRSSTDGHAGQLQPAPSAGPEVAAPGTNLS